MGKIVLPAYLIRNHYSYCFRLVVPQDLKKIVGKTELRYSLQTGNLCEAKERSQLVVAFVKHLFWQMRRDNEMATLSPDEISTILKDYLKQLLRYSEGLNTIIPTQVNSRDSLIEEAREKANECRDMLLENEFDDETINAAKLLLKKLNTKIDESSLEFKVLCREILKTTIQYFEIEEKRLQGDYAYEQNILSLNTVLKGDEASITLQQIVGKYIEEKKHDKKWRDKTADKHAYTYRLLCDYLGVVPINSITRDMIKTFRDALKKCPSNMHKRAQYKGKSIREVSQMNVPDEIKLDATTVNDHLGRLHGLFEYCIGVHYYKHGNPVYDLYVVDLGDAGRDPYTNDELIRLFASNEFVNDKFDKAFKFWIPVISLFSGMRLEEICHLNIKDIKCDDGIYYFSIIQDIKNESSKRKCPFHPFLVELGFHKYVDELRQNGIDERDKIFHELKPDKYNKFGDMVSKWFNTTYKKRCGIITLKGQMKDFHSFRKTMINWFKQNIPDSHKLRVLSNSVGHEVKVDDHLSDMTMNTYGNEYQLSIKYDVLSELNYGIDLSHLKTSRFARLTKSPCV